MKWCDEFGTSFAHITSLIYTRLSLEFPCL